MKEYGSSKICAGQANLTVEEDVARLFSPPENSTWGPFQAMAITHPIHLPPRQPLPSNDGKIPSTTTLPLPSSSRESTWGGWRWRTKWLKRRLQWVPIESTAANFGANFLSVHRPYIDLIFYQAKQFPRIMLRPRVVREINSLIYGVKIDRITGASMMYGLNLAWRTKLSRLHQNVGLIL